VALKVISKQKVLFYNLAEKIVNEIKIQSYLNHPNIVKLYGIFSNPSEIVLI